jgi:hypothetical protein
MNKLPMTSTLTSHGPAFVIQAFEDIADLHG